MKNQFEIATGTIAGRDHFLANKNNQDASCFIATEKTIAAVVCDGCGSSPYPEVGARIGAAMIANSIVNKIERGGDKLAVTALLEEVRQDVLAQLRILANALGGPLPQTVNNYLPFTVVGVLITPKQTVLFSIGDGLLIINDEIIKLGPFPDNAPPYLAYDLIGSALQKAAPQMLKFNINLTLPTELVSRVLIATDGAKDLLKLAQTKMPEKNEVVGPIAQFWQEDRYFKNPENLRRRLTLINRNFTKIDYDQRTVTKENPLLPDDTTLIVIRRKLEAGN